MKRRMMLGTMLGVCLVGCEYVACGAITLPPVLSSHMVLQREMPVPVWGTAAPNEKVTVSFSPSKSSGQAVQTKITTAGSNGTWKVWLEPLSASAEPGTMVISGASEKKELSDVLVGEVWVGSGQSNMAMSGAGFSANDELLTNNIAGGPYPQLRVIVPGQGWRESAPAALRSFSALLFSFGLPLQQDLKVPVGLLVGAVGGTPSGFWLSQEAFDTDQACKDAIAAHAKTYRYDDAVKTYEANLAKWKLEVEAAKQKGETKLPKEPRKPLNAGECRDQVGNLYESFIRPYMPLAIRGVLWDQGEGGTAIEGVDQYTLMGALIRGWRKEWGLNMAFVYVQKPSGGGCAWDMADPVTCKAETLIKLPPLVPGDGAYRETHIRIMGYPNTFMVTSSDLGSGIHPVNKSGYGLRAARVALGGVYGRAVEIYGPVYKSHKIDGGKVTVTFDHVGKGLAFKAEEVAAGAGPGLNTLQGFALAGEKGAFVWADAVIEGNTVVVSSDKVPQPVSVRYAWASQHRWANLFNKDGLPALPFRTDSTGSVKPAH